MAKIDLIAKDWCDMIFEGRNKAYGAYYLRSKQGIRQLKAVISVMIGVVVIITLPLLIEAATPEKTIVEEETIVEMAALEEAKVEEKVQKKYQEATKETQPQQIKSSIKFTAPKIAKDSEVTKEDQVKSQDELAQIKTQIGRLTVGGNSERGVSIDDVKDIITSDKSAKPKEEAPKVYDVVEQRPEFPGGEAALLAFINKNLRYPETAAEQEVQGTVKLRFVVLPNGSVGDVRVIQSLHKDCDKAAVEVVKKLPRFTPGRQQGKAVSVWYTLPIRFRLQ
ncbi:MAG: TonB family protein [Bacteroidales bacterium]|nr:TonB family protein [Bacteroidales bacterium]